MKLRYTMKRTWFTCLEVSRNSEEDSWREEQRFMYLRLRRLVGSVNEHLFENLHYEHEIPLQVVLHERSWKKELYNIRKKKTIIISIPLQIPLTIPLKPPPASSYSGYGEYGGQFFYYGNMNKYAYESKFVHTVNTANLTVETEQHVEKPPCFDLVIEIELKCTPELAPFAVRKILKSDQLEVYEAKTSKNQQLYLRMNVTCPASIANRLPGYFIWQLRSPRRARQNSWIILHFVH